MMVIRVSFHEQFPEAIFLGIFSGTGRLGLTPFWTFSKLINDV